VSVCAEVVYTLVFVCVCAMCVHVGVCGVVMCLGVCECVGVYVSVRAYVRFHNMIVYLYAYLCRTGGRTCRTSRAWGAGAGLRSRYMCMAEVDETAWCLFARALEPFLP